MSGPLKDTWTGLRRVFQLPRNRRRLRADLEEEMGLHVEGRVEDLMSRDGLTRDQAVAEAQRRFGDAQAYARETRAYDDEIERHRALLERVDAIRTELGHAVRTLRHTPGFSLVALLTLALGLGAAMSVFDLLDRIVLRPLPYPTADRLIHIGTLWPRVKGGQEYGISVGQFFYFKEHSETLADLGVYQPDIMLAPEEGAHPAERVPGIKASASLFRVLGIRPEIGRLFTSDESVFPEFPSVVVLSHDYWLQRYGGDPHVLGRRIALDDSTTVEIIGVLPPGASVPDLHADVWRPMQLDPAEPPQNNHTRLAIGLARPHVSAGAVASDLHRLQVQFAALHPDLYSRAFLENSGFRMDVTSLRDTVIGPAVSRTLWMLFASVGLVLLIASGNVANLFLVRVDARRREIAVRTALGANRLHLAVHYIAESVMLTAGSAVVAIGLGYVLLRATLALAPQTLPRLAEVRLDWASATFCLAAAVIVGLFLGCLPLAARSLDTALLGDSGRGLTTSQPRAAARRALIAGEIALAVALVAGSGLMVKSFARLRAVQPGFDPVGVESMDVLLAPPRYHDEKVRAGFWQELSRRVAAIPGVQRVGAAAYLPLTGEDGCAGIALGSEIPETERHPCVQMIEVTPGYFATMRIPLTGREPSWQDVESGTGALVVSRAFANRFWPGQNPLGRRIHLFRDDLPPCEIVGIAADVRANGLREPPIEAVYFPIVRPASAKYWESGSSMMSIVIRSSPERASTLIPSIRRVVADLDPHVAVADVMPMDVILAKSMADTSFVMLLLAIAATIALALSIVGIYGVVSYIVAQRRAEIGIRMALGAQVAAVGRMVVGESLVVAAIGIGGGLLVASLGTRLLRSLLFEVSPLDPLVFIAAPITVLLLATAASLLPARRAARVDPSIAMRVG